MAMIATNFAPAAFANGVLTRIGHAILDMTERANRNSQAYKAASYAAELSRMTDEQLAARGLKRSEVVQHAFTGILLV